MQKSTKIYLIVATSIMILGVIIFGGVMTVLKWNFTNLSTFKYETNSYKIDQEYKDILITTDTANVTLLPSEDGNTLVVCDEQVKMKHTVEVKEGSFVWDVFKSTTAEVNCFHGWELDRLAPVFDVVAKTADGVAEAIEWKEKNIFATQWHPERSFHDSWDNEIEQKFFENFIECCKRVKEQNK